MSVLSGSRTQLERSLEDVTRNGASLFPAPPFSVSWSLLYEDFSSSRTFQHVLPTLESENYELNPLKAIIQNKLLFEVLGTGYCVS